jgi:hypothetical protein
LAQELVQLISATQSAFAPQSRSALQHSLPTHSLHALVSLPPKVIGRFVHEGPAPLLEPLPELLLDPLEEPEGAAHDGQDSVVQVRSGENAVSPSGYWVRQSEVHVVVVQPATQLTRLVHALLCAQAVV